MINNSTNIIKTNNHLSPSLTDHEEKTMTHDVGNPGPGLRQAQKFSVLKSVSVNFAYFSIYLTKLKIPDDCLANWALKSPVWWNWYMVGFLFVCWTHSWLECSLDGPIQNMFFFVSAQKSKMIIFCITVHICRTICWNERKISETRNLDWIHE